MQKNRVCRFGLIPGQRRQPYRSHAPNGCQVLLIAIILAAPGALHAQQTNSPILADAAPPAPASAVAPIEVAEPLSASSASPNPESPDLLSPNSGSADSSVAIPSADTTAVDEPEPGTKRHKHTPESEIAVEGMVSYGNWEIFAAGINESLYTAGFEYDRHSWGHFAGAQMDYAADFMPLVLLKEPRVLNPYGIDRSKPGDNVIIPGMAFSPIGLRMEWRHTKSFKPYFTVLGGAIGFTKKALSPDASYFDFTLHESIGFYLKMTERVDMRFGLFGDFHFSNAYITNYNPGLDVMNSNLAVSYHFGG